MTLLITIVALFACLVLTISTHAIDNDASTASEINLASTIQNPSTSLEAIYPKAMEIIASLDSAPSCHRLAALNLINSCRGLEESQSSKKSFPNRAAGDLDLVKSSFAARLAICELISAHAELPSECKEFAPQNREHYFFHRLFKHSQERRLEKNDFRSFEFAEFNPSHLDQCLRSLESRPQWWTSYSNARQNAVSICHATRHEIEKDEILKTHYGLATIVADLSNALSVKLKQSTKAVELGRVFEKKTQDFQDKLLEDLELHKVNALTFFGKIIKNFEGSVRELSFKVSETMKDFKLQLDDLHMVIQTSAIAAKKGCEDVTAAQEHSFKAHEASVLALQHSTDLMKEREIQSLATLFASIRSELQATTMLISQMNHKQKSVDEVLFRVDNALNDLQTKTVALQQSQADQADIQSQLISRVQSQLNITVDMVMEVTNKIAKLDQEIDQTFVQIFAMGSHLSNICATVKQVLFSCARYGFIGLFVASIVVVACSRLCRILQTQTRRQEL